MGLAFERLLDRCQVEHWSSELAFGKRGWELSIRDDQDELLARARSTLKAPEAFDRLATAVAVALGRNERA